MDKRLINIKAMFYIVEDPSKINVVDKKGLKARVGYQIGAGWVQIYLTPGTLVFEEVTGDDDDGYYAKQKFSGSAPSNTLSDDHDRATDLRSPLYIRMDDVKGDSYVVGISGDAISLTLDRNTATGETIVSFEREDDTPALLLY